MANGISPVINSDSAGSSGAEDKTQYWAGQTDSKRLASSVVARIKAYRENMRQTGLSTRIRKSWAAVMGYGPRSDSDASRITSTGDIGELLNINVNEYAGLMNQVITLTTGNKPAVKAIAANSDFKSLGQAAFAESLNDYYDTELQVSDREYSTVQSMVALGEGHIAIDWDASVGQPFTVTESGKVVRSGDVREYTCTPFDIAREPHLQDIESQTWVAFRRKVSKWELIALYPDQKDAILAHCLKFNDSYNDGIDGQAFTGDEFSLDFRQKNPTQNLTSDMVFLWEFRHKPTAALPNGRLVKFLGDDCVLFDTVETVPAGMRRRGTMQVDRETGTERMLDVWTPEEVIDHGYPYGDQLFFISGAPERTLGGIDGKTSFFDLMSLQEGVDLTHSIMGSAINAGGLQNMFVPRGSNITANKLSGVLNIIEYDGDQVPIAKDNVSINAAVPAWFQSLVSSMQRRVALNEVTTGDMQRAMPAQAMALLRAQAIEFHSRLQAAYENLIQRNRTAILKMLQLFADADRVALIAGKDNMWAMESFKSQDLKDFDRFVIEPINPMMKTLAGKVSFALPLLEKGIISPEQYLQLGNTGRLEPIDKYATDNQARRQREKEKMLKGIGLPPVKMAPQMTPMGPQMMPVINNDGIPELDASDGKDYVVPLITDPFWLDIPDYARLLEQPGIRAVPDVLNAINEVLHRCMMLWSKQPLALTLLLKGMPYPREQIGVPPPDGAAPGGPPAPTMQNTPPVDAQKTNQLPAGAPPVRQPKPPKLRMADSQLQQVAEENPPPQ